MRRVPVVPAFTVLGALLVVAALLGLGLGAATVAPGELVSILSLGEAAQSLRGKVIWDLRLPRVVLGLLVGSALSVAGALMQGLFRNPLAEPGLVGVSSGAAVGAAMAIVLVDHIPGFAAVSGAAWLLPLSAFVGALGVTLAIRQLASGGGHTAVGTLLLAGIAVNSLAGAVLGLATFVSDDSQLRSLTFWTLGSLGGATWPIVAWVLGPTLFLLVLAPRLAGGLNALALGEEAAGHLGFRVERLKAAVILLTALAVGAAVAFTGLIGFVGLVIPHLIRLSIGPDHRLLIPGSALLGGALLVVADTLARLLVAPAELPLGILTALIGAPFFLAMLFQQRRRMAWL